MIHEIKCLKEFFEPLINGWKKFEVRHDDRGYRVGDLLAINEVEEEPIQDDMVDYITTGRSAIFKIIYILDDEKYCKKDYVVMGIQPCMVSVVGNYGNLTIIEREE